MSGVLNLCVSVALLLSQLTLAAPPIKERSVSSSVLQNFNLFEQYSCAAYNPQNFNRTGTLPTGIPVTCQPGKCPLVQGATTKMLAEFSDPGITDVTGFVAADEANHFIVVSFRGSDSIDNWIADFTPEFFDVHDELQCDGCQAHLGFWASWVTARNQILDTLDKTIDTYPYPKYKIVVTGHSYGGAVATLAAAQLRYLGFDVALYNYGSPAVGNQALATYITKQPGGNYRVTHTDDPAPRYPPPIVGYAHISPEYWITSGNDVPVKASDIQYLPNNNGDVGILEADFSAHLWYFNHITEC